MDVALFWADLLFSDDGVSLAQSRRNRTIRFWFCNIFSSHTLVMGFFLRFASFGYRFVFPPNWCVGGKQSSSKVRILRKKNVGLYRTRCVIKSVWMTGSP